MLADSKTVQCSTCSVQISLHLHFGTLDRHQHTLRVSNAISHYQLPNDLKGLLSYLPILFILGWRTRLTCRADIHFSGSNILYSSVVRQRWAVSREQCSLTRLSVLTSPGWWRQEINNTLYSLLLVLTRFRSESGVC